MSKNKANRADLARQAIEYLVEHDFVLTWDFSATEPPPEEIRRLLAPYFADGEIEPTTSRLLCEYLVSRLREDYPLTDNRSRSVRDCARRVPWSAATTAKLYGGGNLPLLKPGISESKTEFPGSRFHQPGVPGGHAPRFLSMEPQMKTLYRDAVFPCTSRSLEDDHGQALSRPPHPAGAAFQQQPRVSSDRSRSSRRVPRSPHPYSWQEERVDASYGVARPASASPTELEEVPQDSI